MLLFFFILEIAKSNSKKASKINETNTSKIKDNKDGGFCRGANTKITNEGKCECFNSNFYGDPNSPEGCLPCDIKCHRNGVCVGRDKCKCKRNYFGDGVKECRKPIPTILSYWPKVIETENAAIFFHTKKVKEFNPTEIYCLTGSFITYGEILNRTYFKCDFPMNRRGIYSVRLSFDSEVWSEGQRIENNSGNSASSSIYSYAVLVFFAVTFFAAIYWNSTKSKEFKNESTEILPLNKWYIHQIQQEIGEENRISEFLSHLITN